ncbi:MAG: hypothetical protein HYV68_00960 [Candidatus Taylorbacteria bacterium]|nr:hypothetical protein [Candidatus Taylorbacteria bacterium]
MAFSWFSGKGKEKNAGILFEISSSGVGASIVVFETGIKPTVVFQFRQTFPVESRLDNRKFLPTMTEALSVTVGEIAAKGLIRLESYAGRKIPIKRIMCVFSSPWDVSTTRALHFKFEQSFVISPTFLNDVIAYEGRNFLAAVSKSNKDAGERKHILAERDILKTAVNGYPVRYPTGRQADDFEMTLFLSALPQALNRSVERICQRQFPDSVIELYSATGVYFSVLRRMVPDERSFIITHIGGETTDVSVVKDNAITETISFPLGRNFVIRRLMEEISGITPSVALSMINVHQSGDAAPRMSQKLQSVLSQVEADWVGLFADSMHDFAKDFFLPTRVFVLAGDNAAGTFADLITKQTLPVRGHGTPPIVAEAVKPELFHNTITCAAGEECDPFLSAEILFLNLQSAEQKVYFERRGKIEAKT